MSKEKTRAELHAIIAGLKDDLQVTDGNLQNATIAHRELKEKYDALEKEAKELKSKVSNLNGTINNLYNKIRSKEAIVADKEQEIERLKERESYLEGELKEKTELNESQGERIQKYIERVERMQADLDKAQYIAADLLKHGVFHFLIVKYRNLRAK